MATATATLLLFAPASDVPFPCTDRPRSGVQGVGCGQGGRTDSGSGLWLSLPLDLASQPASSQPKRERQNWQADGVANCCSSHVDCHCATALSNLGRIRQMWAGAGGATIDLEGWILKRADGPDGQSGARQHASHRVLTLKGPRTRKGPKGFKGSKG